MKFKIISFLILFGLSSGILASCSNGNIDHYADINLEVIIDDSIFEADTINSEVKNNNIAVYTRDYKDKNNVYLLKIGGNHSSRAVISVKYTIDKYGERYTVLSADDSDSNKSETPIPVNGFVISIPLSVFGNTIVKTNKEISVKGFEEIAPEYERLDLGTVIPENKALTRRISYINPALDITVQPCITFITNDYEKDIYLPSGAIAFILRLVASNNYRINSIQEGGTIPKGNNALVFVGEFNSIYAKTFFENEDKLFISRLDDISPYSDSPAIIIKDSIHKIRDDRTNPSIINESGIYIFNSYYDAMITPSREIEFCDIVVIKDTVVYKGEKNKRILIPYNDGIVISFNGDKLDIADKLNIGDSVLSILTETRNLPDMFLSADNIIYKINEYNTERTENISCVLYSSEYGSNTGTDSDGIEIIIIENKITAIEVGKGNAFIPDNGYVFSISKSNELYKNAEQLNNESIIHLSVSGNVYSTTSLEFDGINIKRNSNKLVVYRDHENTKTNEYGYEIIVNEDGIITGENHIGSSRIPEGGYVLSGHGIQETALKNAFVLGAKVILNEDERTVVIISNPMLKLENAINAYDHAINEFNKAKQEFYAMDYISVGKELDKIGALIKQTETAITENEYPVALQYSVLITEKLNRLKYAMIRSNTVENRAAWYRSNEKNDNEVTKVIQKALSLNINTIYLETWYNGMVIGYSDNKLIKHHSIANGNFDALEAFCRIGHKYGVEIHAWVENFFIGTLDASTQSDTLINKTSGKHLLDSQGNNYNQTIYGDYVFLNPYDRDNRDLILNLYKEIITKYDIDGIHLDYIRFPEYNFNTYDYGYNEDIIEGFKEKYNTSLNPKSLTKGTEMHDKWCKFREDIINSWVEEIYNLVIHTKPGLWISAACYPDVENASKTIFQNVSDWVDNGWIDEVFSMTYSANNDYVIENAKLFENIVKDKAFYSVGISAFGTTNEYDFVTQLDIIRDIGADGSAIFSLGNITPENYGRFIVEGSYSKKSIQTYLLEKTVSTGLNDILHKLDVIYDFGNALFTSDITKKINEIISKSDNFNSSNSTIDQKFSYANKTIVDLNHLINIVNEYKINPEIDQEKLKAIEDDFRVLLRYITKTKNRLNARLT